jgi:glycosyltransferase involved in cell wall biosynthesis
MSKNIWLVNDCLTTIPGTVTFWHNLLNWIPDIVDKTNGYTPYANLAFRQEINYYLSISKPSLIIRNASFFRKIRIPTNTISLVQDILDDKTMQLEVCNNSKITVFNSEYTYSKYSNNYNGKYKIIPLGIDTNYFVPAKNKAELKKKLSIKSNTILFVGAENKHPKGFNIVNELINNTSFDFCLVMKDNYYTNNPRVKVFNKINHQLLLQIYQACDLLVCTSYEETQHLAGIEAASTNMPIVTNNIGIYYNQYNKNFGEIVQNNDVKQFIEMIEKILGNPNDYMPRSFVLRNNLNIDDCKSSWQNLINENI